MKSIVTVIVLIACSTLYCMNGLKTNLEHLDTQLKQLQKSLPELIRARLKPNLGLLYRPGEQPLTRLFAHLVNELNNLIRTLEYQTIGWVVEVGNVIPASSTLVAFKHWILANELPAIKKDLTDLFAQYPNNPNKIIVLLKAGQKDEHFGNDRIQAKKELTAITPHVFVFMLNALQSKKSATEWSTEEQEELNGLANLFE